MAPETGRADAARVEQAVSALTMPQPQASLGVVEDLALYGLAEPDVRVTLVMKDGAVYGFEVGRQAPTGAGFYVQLEGEAEVHVLSSYALGAVLDLLEELPLEPTATPEASATP